MLHLLLYGLLALVLAVGLFAVAVRFLPAGEQIAPPVRDEPPWELPPDRALSPADIDGVRLPVALRGYRFAETDLLLDRLAGELRGRDEEIARLRGGPSAPEPAPEAAEPSAPGPPSLEGPASGAWVAEPLVSGASTSAMPTFPGPPGDVGADEPAPVVYGTGSPPVVRPSEDAAGDLPFTPLQPERPDAETAETAETARTADTAETAEPASEADASDRGGG